MVFDQNHPWLTNNHIVATRVYIAHLSGLTVFDPNADPVGRVRDVVVRTRQGDAPPRVIGLVAEVPIRRRIFVPIGRVTDIEPNAIMLGTGTVNLRRFSLRPNELLVMENLFNRRVTVETGAATVVDVAMECDRLGEWFISRLAIRQHVGRLARKGPLLQVEYSYVNGLIAQSEKQGTAGLLAMMDNLRAPDFANALQDLPDAHRVEIAAALHDERLADVLQELPEQDQIEIIAALDQKRAADVLEEMDPDDAADLLSELSSPERDILLNLMAPEEASPVRQLLGYLPGTAGAIMTSEPVIMPPDSTVADALARIRESRLPAAIAAAVFVTRSPTSTPTGRYLGIAHFQRLLREPPSSLLGGVIDNSIDPIGPSVSLSEITKQMATYNLVSMPVVDDRRRLLGSVTVDDVLDHLLPTHWRDRDHDG